MRLLPIFIIIFIFSSLTNAQKIGEWRTTDDFTVDERVGAYPDAFVLHTVANVYFVKKFEDYGFEWWQADLTIFGLGILWEVKDGYIPIEKVKIIGGDGFSYADLGINTTVICLNRMLSVMIREFNISIHLGRRIKVDFPIPL